MNTLGTLVRQVAAVAMASLALVLLPSGPTPADAPEAGPTTAIIATDIGTVPLPSDDDDWPWS